MSTQVLLEPAFVLHRRPYSDTSLIVELFSVNHGRISAVARSARGLKSRYKGKLELFSPLLVSWLGGRELKTLGNVELHGRPTLLDGDTLLCGFYLNELLMRLLHRDDPYPDLFDAYKKTLENLSNGAPVQILLRCFEKKLLHELGYGLPLNREIETGLPIEPSQYYHYIPDRGFLKSERDDSQIAIFSGHSLIALHNEQFDEEETLKEIKRLMRMAIGRHLGNKPLQSRELLKSRT
ncbi:DNA repair protein RecO [Candidiatus Paracoxiella cheracis]|uniref:DNA repair protein RecO n=1 Tax=Candidiatus Paracoxiella cheracis TaxID=3405120 RepID=UPI003BF45DB9